MATVYIGLGSNIGDKRGNLVRAAALLAERVGDILALSSIYKTPPWGFQSANSFRNAALIQITRLTPLELLDATRLIEIEMGRVQKTDTTYNDRIIDIDILMYDDLIMRSDRLTLPHPLMHKRQFVMEPLAEIAPAAIHPVFHQTMEELYAHISDS
ncbi:2-amino-4-hydroxy-6-hydroxymethyldihydropteridine diphosphokinase [Parabacteroides sp. PF5-6]|uniref:2-amino-4-hydroxy-6- hydroxymethyldihydropteridine diphosphokinase n=1 Tax=Parabacteroides sp. PF5-6 TaxID=1742403 RepID=UPI00240691F4|nr:2-amino-4-hydroxy-6-hydroxymethyldihydropteridine diphosphokinase [Parabacteroides sp. PF5-6]MDF9829220.1 2-amino-4-hydroxy-6-hydroxymethyldihydropteridine diphosphokinase [Parabacteroides sp. PF5-6]